MLELPHALVGATLAIKIPNPAISLPLSLASHFLIDLIPHWNPDIYQETLKFGKPKRKSTQIVIGDTLLSLGIGLWLASLFLPNTGKAITVILGCFGAVLPDVIEGFYFFLGKRGKFLEKLIHFQRAHQHKTYSLCFGILTQLITIAFCFLLIFA